MTATPTIVLFRRDLRLFDNPALAMAVEAEAPVLPLYVLDEAEPFAVTGAARWWLHHSLAALRESLEARGSKILLRRSNTEAAIRELAAATGARCVAINRRHLRPEGDRDAAMVQSLAASGIRVETFSATLLREPHEVRAAATGRPFQVFTPFFKALRALGPGVPEAQSVPPRYVAPEIWPDSDRLEDWQLTPKSPVDWAAEFGAHWTPGEAGAEAAFSRFIAAGANRYADERDRPDLPSTSRLSPHFAFGEISVRAAWRRIVALVESGALNGRHAEKFLSEIGWREFAQHLLAAFPHMTHEPLRPEFADFPWVENKPGFRAWRKGLTGYPIVDAGMRELWRTGWMHNRVRMIVASFLIKDLLVSWREGEAWFRDTLVDYDTANNVASWQWVAGSGADAAPYFRIFNPILQGEKFDPDGAYVRRFVPELAHLPAQFIHRPWEAPELVLRAADVRLGDNYPHPIVDHSAARAAALAAMDLAKRRAGAAADQSLGSKR